MFSDTARVIFDSLDLYFLTLLQNSAVKMLRGSGSVEGKSISVPERDMGNLGLGKRFLDG